MGRQAVNGAIAATWKALRDPIKGARREFLSIDLLRGISALSILLFHFGHFAMGGPEFGITPADLERLGLLRALHVVVEHGGLAVMLFWTISGFVFMNVYAGTRPRGWVFFVNRFSRLYPLHLVTLIVIAIIQMISMTHFGHYLIYNWNDGRHFVLQLFFASEWGMQAGRSFNGPIWSVSIEVLIYAVFYCYIRYCRTDILTLAIACASCLVALRLMPASEIALCGVFFFGGALAYAVYALVPAGWTKVAGIVAIALAGGIALAGLYGASSALPLTIWLLAAFCPAIIALALSENSPLRILYRKLRFFGDITYSSYLWHSPLQMVFLLGVGFGFWDGRIVANNWFVVAYIAVVLAVSHASFRWIERPAQRLLRARLIQPRGRLPTSKTACS